MMKKRYPPLELTASQSVTLCSIFDTFIAKLTPVQEQALATRVRGKEDVYGVNESQIALFSNISASSLDIKAKVLDFFQNVVEPSKRVDLIRVLDVLATRPGSFLMTGYWEPFHHLSQQNREQVLLSWKHSPMKTFNSLYVTFSGLCLFHAYNRSASPLLKSINYESENYPDDETVNYERIPMMTKDQVTGMMFDAIVVGSGAGGGVVAGELASAGFSVLVIEKGKYYHPSEMVQDEHQGMANMYDGGMTSTSTNGAIQSLTGSTFGGGTAVNFSVSLKPQHFVREEWANKLGLSHFISPQFQQDLERVCDRIGATTDNVTVTKASKMIADGCKKLGYDFERVPLNIGGKEHHYCNSRCMVGCKAGIKNSTANTWLVDALNNGAKFLDRTNVKRVLISKGKAIGVECYVHDSSEVTRIMAKGGLKNNHIGKNLALHPVGMTFAFFDEPIRQTEGPLITVLSNAAENWQGDNYGAKLEDGVFLAGSMANKLPWLGAAEHKDMMMRHKSMISLLVLVRDKDSVGVVDYAPTSPNPVYSYKISKHDDRSLTEGFVLGLKVMVASGARELYTCQAKLEPFKFREDEESRVDNERFLKWIESVHKAASINTPLLSAHHLGSCRMGVTAKSSVVQPSGETWEVKNLHIADGSIVPTAVGVNPMVTIEAVALHVARNVISSLKTKARL